MISKPPKKNSFTKLLLEVIGASAIFHVILLVLFGGFTVWRYVANTGAQFEEPPPMVEEAPPPPNVEVAIQRPRASADLPQREIRMQPVGNIAVAAVPTDVPQMAESFSVAGAGGGDLGRMNIGNVGGRVGLGISQVNMFGLRDEGERIIIAVDAGTNMMVDAKGGLHSYNAIKEEIVRLVGGLAAGTLFNVVVYDSTRNDIDQFQPNLVAATPQNVERLTNWFMPINSDPQRLGVRRNSVAPRNVMEHPVGEMLQGRDFHQNAGLRLSHVILEQNVDLVYIITSEWRGFTRMRRQPTEREQAEEDRRRQTPEFQRQLEAHQGQMEELRRRVQEAERADNERRQARGLPARVWRHGHLHEKARAYNIPYIPDPRWSFQFWIEAREVETYFRQLIQQEYREEGRTVPRFNVIMFLSEEEEFSRDQQESLRNFLRYFRNGRFRELRGLRAIQSHQGGRT